MLTILLLLVIAWICVGANFVIQRRREGRTDSSVASFRQQLSTLERATPGSVMRHSVTGPVPVVKMEHAPAKSPLSATKRRRRDVLVGLGSATIFFLLVRLMVPGMLTTALFVLSAVALGAYVWALRQLHLRALERSAAVQMIQVDRSNVTSITTARDSRSDERSEAAALPHRLVAH